MKKLLQIAVVALLLYGLFGCAAKKEMKAYYGSEHNVEASIVSVGNDGTKLIKVWGTGKKVETAVIHAKRNAVNAAIFHGFAAGGGSAKVPPIVKDSDAKSKHKAFFDEFFKDGGRYLQYVDSKTDGWPSGKDRIKVDAGYRVAITVAVESDRLRKYLEEKGIARKLDAGF